MYMLTVDSLRACYFNSSLRMVRLKDDMICRGVVCCATKLIGCRCSVWHIDLLSFYRMERYTQNSETPSRSSSSDNSKLNRLSTFTEEFKCLQSNLLGQNLELLSLRDLIQLEYHMHTNLVCIRTKKEELLFKQLEDIKEKVNKALRTINVNSNTKERMEDVGHCEVTRSRNLEGQGDSECVCSQVTPEGDTSLSKWANTSDPSIQGLVAANELRACMEE